MPARDTSDSLNTTARFFVSARNGSEAELEHLVKRIQARLMRFCVFLTGNPVQARDLCQEAYVKLIENLRTLEEPKFFMTWLFRITKNIFLDYVRSPKNRPHADVDDLGDALSPVLTLESDVQLFEALAKLSGEDRLLLLMVHLEGCTYEETAEALGLPVSVVKGRLFRIRGALREILA